ncbi:MAG: ATP-binding protein [Burkholderiaceae bacterium]
MKWPWPRSLFSQLMVMFAVILLIMQAANLFLLIGERRINARAQQFSAQLANYLDAAAHLPSLQGLTLPQVLREGPPSLGVVFLSANNRALLAAPGRRDAERERRVAEGLSELGHPGLVAYVTHRAFEQRRNPAPRGPGGPPPPDRLARPADAQHAPPQMPPAGAVFHPARPPDAGGPPAPGLEEIVISTEIVPGVWLNAMVAHYAQEAVTIRVVGATAIAFVLAMLAGWLIARRVSQPVQELAAAALAFGRGEQAPPLPERGPREVRVATLAFNEMRQRLANLIESQRMMLRAIGHDLRTPLTSLRIRAEDLPASANRDRIIATIQDMSLMTEEILAVARDASAIEAPAAVDITALVASLADDFQDRDLDVSAAEPGARIVASVRRVALRRVLTNLINNAVQYGERARLMVHADADSIRITVDDDGPGIAPDRLDEVMKPFVRLESSRSRSTGGSGLGLAICNAILAAQGGQLALRNRAGGGLRAELSLPLAGVVSPAG